MRGVGYLIPVALVAASTACAVRRPRHSGRSGTAALLVGFGAASVPGWLMGCLAALTAFTWWSGDLLTPLGLVGLVLAVGALAGLALVVAASGRPTRAAVARAFSASGLSAELPAAGRDTLLVPRATPGNVLLPFRRRRGDVERIRDVSYGPDPRRHRLDLYRSRETPPTGPVLVHFHGGHFVSGRRDRESLPLLYHLAAAGWIAVSADYALGGAAAFPQAHVDAKRAIAWVREHIARYGGDPAQVVVAGNSAGAHLALFAALTADEARYQPGFEHARTAVAAAVGLGGYYGPLLADRPDSAVAAHVHAAAPPVLLLHGENDPVVPAEAARRLAHQLTSVSRAAVVHATLPRAGHNLDYFHSSRTRAVIAAVAGFSRGALSAAPTDPQEAQP
jgi:acetyl esterase/lipase